MRRARYARRDPASHRFRRALRYTPAMLKVMAVLRTAVVAILIPYLLWALPWNLFHVTKTFDEQYARCAASLQQVTIAAVAGVAWLLVETLVGWRLAFPKVKAAGAAPAAPPAPEGPGPRP